MQLSLEIIVPIKQNRLLGMFLLARVRQVFSGIMMPHHLKLLQLDKIFPAEQPVMIYNLLNSTELLGLNLEK